MRLLTEAERGNVAFLTTNRIPHGTIQPTRTGLEKSILDATEVFREFLETYGIHDYAQQPQGTDSKVSIPTVLFDERGNRVLASGASLYRPLTKSGDPRIWFSGLPKIAKPDDIVAVIWHDRAFLIVNLSVVPLHSLRAGSSELSSVLSPYLEAKQSTVSSLLDLLNGVAQKGFLRAPVKGSTAVGRLLETELGIDINSRKAPDFFGIELKSSRAASNRTTLFAKTPDWARSRYKRSAEILEAFGYDRDGVKKLSCTLSGKVVNSQGLSVRVRESLDELHAVSDRIDPRVAVWDLAALRHSLNTKHDETFWVKAVAEQREGWEYIKFVSVEHTSKPMIEQLSPSLASGVVTVDFLIRESGDKGYLFKVLPKNLKFLFPPSKAYALAAATA